MKGKKLTKGHKHLQQAKQKCLNMIFQVKPRLLQGISRQIWALAHSDRWGPCNRHENLIMSHRHNDGDEVLEQWLSKLWDSPNLYQVFQNKT